MCLREKFRHYRPDFQKPVRTLEADELVQQFLYLESGLADSKDRRGISLGLPKDLSVRRDNLLCVIISALVNNNNHVHRPEFQQG